MIKPSAAFNLTKIIESLDVSASSVSENTLKSGVEREQFSVAFASAMDQVREKTMGAKAAALSESGKSLPLSSLPQRITKEELVGNTETISLLKLDKIDEKGTKKIHINGDSHEREMSKTESEIHTEFKLQTVRFMNGRKVLTSIVDQVELPELSGNYKSDLYTVFDDIDQNYSPSVEIKSLPQDPQLKLLPLWWQKQNIPKVEQYDNVSLAGRMAVAHSKKANINAVLNKEPTQTSEEITLNRSKHQKDDLGPYMPELTEVIQRFQSFIQANVSKSNFGVKENSVNLVASSAESNLNAARSKNGLGFTEQQMSRLREYISDNLKLRDVMDNARFERNFEVFANSNLGQQSIQKLAAAMNGTVIGITPSTNSNLDQQSIQNLAAAMKSAGIDITASMNSNLGAQVIKNLETAMKKTDTINKYDEHIAQYARTESIEQPIQINQKATPAFLLDKRFASLMPANNGSRQSLENIDNNGFNQAVHVQKPAATISGANTSQPLAFSTNLGMTQHQTNEGGVQAQSTYAPFYNQEMSRLQFGEQLIKIVAREIEVPQQDGVDSLRIEITPPDLGDLEIELRKQGKDLLVRILASTEAAAEAIKDHSTVLKNLLGNHDLSRVQVNVDIDKREHSSRQEQGHTKEGDLEKKHEQRFVKVRIHDGVIDTFV